ncbi:ABC transporter substrate-binding protein [Halobium palmae]|uniref:ABC transporter substrate-binding protein n=1 Tax=Halobium palmae TaxID=1776492 RepID=A0ABD5S023_9EURY
MSHETSTRRSFVEAAGAAGVAASSGLAGCTAFGGAGGAADTITVAATVPETGRLSSVGTDLLHGYRLGAQRMQGSDAIEQDVELVVEDDESDPKEVRSQLQQIISNNDVDVVWGSFSSPLVMAGSAVAEQRGLPFLAVATCYMEPLRSGSKEWTYTPFPKTRDVVRATRQILQLVPEGERPSRVGIWEPNSGWGSEMATAWEESLTEAGYEVVQRSKFASGTKDFSTLISRAASANVEILLSNPQPPDGITAMTQLSNRDYMPSLVEFVRAADPESWWSALGETGNYVTMSPGWVHGVTGNGNEAMLEAWRSEYGDDSDNEVPRVMVGAGYNLTQTVEQALSAAESVESGAIRDALDSATFHTVVGVFGFDEHGMPKPGQLDAPSGQWKDGRQELIYPRTENASELRYPIEE